MLDTLVKNEKLHVEIFDEGFEVLFNSVPLLHHTLQNPMVFVGKGEETIEMYRGNFDIKDYLTERIPLKYAKVEKKEKEYIVNLAKFEEGKILLSLTIKEEDNRLKVEYNPVDDSINRFWMRIKADEKEKVYGCGEQLSYFNMRGKNFPLWTSEPGVGRNKNTYVTWQADVIDKAGGDYYNTNFPQPTYVSSKKYYC
ncbi:MAG TPA: alpha-glucosidase, partial [Ureibacillus sp.]|nr:alpha-glucosidase [Ureibacillus sp.]